MSDNKTQITSPINSQQPIEATWPFQVETPDIVKNYFKAVGISQWVSQEQFERQLTVQFGGIATNYLTAAAGNQFIGQEVSAKCGNLDLALAVRSQFDASRFQAFFTWIAQFDLRQTKQLLDVGCDVGITTCFLAMHCPQATVVGIDTSCQAVECAKQLAARLQLKNVQFVVADILHLPKDLEGQKFDMIFSTFVADEFMCGGPWSPRSVEDMEIDESGIGYARALATLLADDKSSLVSFELMFGPHPWAVWLRTLREAGIHACRDGMELLAFENKEHDYFEMFPVLIGCKTLVEPPTAEEIRSMWTPGLEEIPEQDMHQGIEAESVFMAIEPKELCWENFDFPDHPYDERIFTEVWAADSELLIYKYGDDDRTLVRLPTEDPKHFAELLAAVLKIEDRN